MKNCVLMILATIVLTSGLGRIQYGDHTETWYNLPMNRCVQRAQDMGIPCEYWVRDDGVKMFGQWVIVAADKSIPYGTVVETSRGIGIVLDYHETESNVYDLAVSWRKEGKK